MLRLNLENEPQWMDFGSGLRLLLRPFDMDLMAEAEEHDELVAARAELDPEEPTDEQKQALGEAMGRVVAHLAILEWEGVGDADGKPFPKPFPEGIDALLRHPRVFFRFQRDYLQPGLLLGDEGNDFAPAPNGISAGVRTIAKPAQRAARTAQKKTTGRKR